MTVVTAVECDVFGPSGEHLCSADEPGLAREIAEWLTSAEAMVAADAEVAADRDLAEQSHRYRDLDGNVLPGVTSVCKLAEEGMADAFARAARRLALEGLDHRVEWGYKADLGNRLHVHADALLQGRDVDCLPDELGFVDGIIAAIEGMQMLDKLVATEAVVLSPARECECGCGLLIGYGGRLDTMLTDGVWDWKSGSPRAMPHTLQLNAIDSADGFARYDEHGKLVAIEPFEPRGRGGCIYVDREGGYSPVPYPVGPQWAAHFRRLLDTQTHNRALARELTTKGSKR